MEAATTTTSPLVLDTRGTAHALGISERQVRHLASKRALPRIHIDRRARFSVDDIRDFIARARR